jgi:hypothetical protein
MRRVTGSPTDNPEAITGTVQDWLKIEYGTAGAGRNTYLDSLEGFYRALSKPYDDPSNTTAAKTLSHLGRLTGAWWQGFETDPRNDYLSARQLFGVLMLLSGSHRTQVSLQASNQNNYTERRHATTLGINLRRTVEDRLDEYAHDKTVRENALSLEGLYRVTTAATTAGLDCLEFVHRRGAKDAKQKTSPSVEYLQGMQVTYAKLAVDHITFAAQIRNGELASVPFLQPISITDQPENPVYYPFAGESPSVVAQS